MLFDSDFVFDDRFSGQEQYFDGVGEIYLGTWSRRNTLVTNFLPAVPDSLYLIADS